MAGGHRSAVSGAREAVGAVWRIESARIVGALARYTGDFALAEDVAQEAFLRAWRYAPAYDARRGSVHTWMLVITRNLAIDAMRLRKARPVDPEVLTALDLETPAGTGPEATAETNAEVRELRAALADLPPEQRQAVLLAALCGRTAAEISESESIPLGTAKTRIRTGLLKVRSSMSRRRSDQ